jgi:uncharacterized membrane protein
VVAGADSAVAVRRGVGDMNWMRVLRHLWFGERAVQRALPESVFDHIQAVVHEVEAHTRGQIRVVVEDSLPLAMLWRDMDTRVRALAVFAQVGVWDTQDNCGVLIYLLFADRAVEIVADRGAHQRVDPAVWDAICRDMEFEFRAQRFEEGLINGVRAIGRILAEHYPSTGAHANELPDRPRII